MKHSTNYIGKVGIQRCPISEDETMILHDYHYREILEDQEGGKYFIAEDGETWYFDLLPLNGTKPTATTLPSIHEEGKFTDLPKLLAIGLETSVVDDAQIIMETGEHIFTIERSPSLEIAQEIIKRYNEFENMYLALKEILGWEDLGDICTTNLNSAFDEGIRQSDQLKEVISKAKAILNKISNQ